MRTFFGMILGALLLVCGVYVYDSMNTSSVANGQVAQANRTIVNWEVAATDCHFLFVLHRISPGPTAVGQLANVKASASISRNRRPSEPTDR